MTPALAQALDWLQSHVGPGKVGLGFDVATTTNGTSNPSAVAVAEESGVDTIFRAVFTWKENDPDEAMARVWSIVHAVSARPAGGRPRRLCVDGTNERYFAVRVRKELGAVCPVEIVVASETIQLPGQDSPLTLKQYLGSLLVAELDDNHLWLPPERALREDWRLVRKEKGQFVCMPDTAGRHGDTFDASKLALRALRSTSGAIETMDGVRTGGAAGPHFHPRQYTGRANPA